MLGLTYLVRFIHIYYFKLVCNHLKFKNCIGQKVDMKNNKEQEGHKGTTGER